MLLVVRRLDRRSHASVKLDVGVDGPIKPDYDEGNEKGPLA